MKSRLPVLLLATMTAAGVGATQKWDLRSIEDRTARGRKAYENKNFIAAVEEFRWLSGLFPDHAGLHYRLARALVRAGSVKEGLAQLERALELGGGREAGSDPAFDPIRAGGRFRAMAAKIEALNKPVGRAEIAFRVGEKDLIPEGIAYDPVDERIYLGSIYKRKIVSIDRNGTVRDFAAKECGLWAVLGVRVDPERRILWANSLYDDSMIDRDHALPGKTGVFKFDLRTGKLLKRYVPEGCSGPCMFNDLTVNSRGDVFITELERGAIYTIRNDRDKLEFFLEPGTLAFPNGIAISDDGRYLFTADMDGISRISTETKSIATLTHPADVSLSELDGLYFHNGRLYAVQNGWTPERIQEFRLNRALDAVEEARTLVANDPNFIIPTTGALAGGWFYIIANSQIASFNEDGTIFPSEKLKDVIILKVKL